MLRKSILAFTVLSVLSHGVTFAQKQQLDIQRIEPAFWWVGMKNPELQLLVYGKDISTAVATLQYEGVEITRTEKTENPNYQFIYLTINNTAKPGKFPITFQVGKEEKSLHLRVETT
jgi:hypothetical protein